ncbi:MAG: SUF system NifU family Fe-S cluster assembly protein [Bacilli bacterium]|nr:SUF system NifU family Fe-S cluster assembly protein [Bacilli bacterium]MDD3895440.1 SUF system NifU family Fe-S cluster assembly protein [Bacilli bacterium]MDD4407601.1 SUF system NifU family Fe-S cluster assembly protein [Bacilli bacterium]
MDTELKRQIMLENYSNPFHKETKGEDYIKTNANNISCIDDINLYLKIENNIIKDAYFDGEACAISTSSTSIMLKNIINKSINDVKEYINNFENMIYEKEYNKEILKEALVYDEIYKQENRKTCATLPYEALKKAIDKNKEIC